MIDAGTTVMRANQSKVGRGRDACHGVVVPHEKPESMPLFDTALVDAHRHNLSFDCIRDISNTSRACQRAPAPHPSMHCRCVRIGDKSSISLEDQELDAIPVSLYCRHERSVASHLGLWCKLRQVGGRLTFESVVHPE